MKSYDNIDMRGNRVRNLASPTLPADAATMGFVETATASSIDGLNGVTAVWKGTQAEYDGIGTKDPSTLYVIT